MTEFSGRTVVVTGAGVGLGRGITLAFAKAGATVWGCDITEAGLAETQALASAPVICRRVDVTRRVEVESFIQEAAAQTGRIDILVNDAGGLCGQTGQAVDDVSEDDWHAIVDTNLTGTFLLTRASVPFMKKVGYGRIVNISSGAGLTTTVTGIQAYAAAKAGQIGLTRQLAKELGRFGITVNSVAPGSIPCNPYSAGKWASLSPEEQHAALKRLATRRVGTPDDIANAVMFFASERTGWVTGQTLSVDGGK